MSRSPSILARLIIGAAVCACFVAAVLIETLRPSAAQDPEPAALPVQLTPIDPYIRYLGRFDLSDANGPRCAWSASTVELRFQGDALNMVVDDTGNDRYQVVVDGWPRSVINISTDHHLYSVVSGLPPGRHVVQIFKRTEAMVGTTQFLGFQLSAGGHLLSAPAPPKRRLLVIGDSISTGYGNEAQPTDGFSADTENAYLSYGAIAARLLHADYQCIAWSGRKLWPDNDIPSIFDEIIPDDSSDQWDERLWRPNVILINLGSNDVEPSMPDKTSWVDAYNKFILHLRATAPRALIYVALGPMLSDADPQGQHQLTSMRIYLQSVVDLRRSLGDRRVRFLEFPQEDPVTGVGALQHPNIKTHEEMAEELAAAIHTDLKWR